jgi:hypothetical protein
MRSIVAIHREDVVERAKIVDLYRSRHVPAEIDAPRSSSPHRAPVGATTLMVRVRPGRLDLDLIREAGALDGSTKNTCGSR